MSDKKYRILPETKIVFLGRELFRIEAIKSFGSIKQGQIGGYIEKEDNLSHEGNAWISENAKIWGNVRIWGDEKIDRKVIYLTTDTWTVTFGNKIQIDCKRYSIEEWRNFNDEEISEMHDSALEWWRKWKDIVLTIAEIACFEPNKNDL